MPLLVAIPILSVAVLCIRLLAASDLDRVAQLPDDSFYYLTLARNFVRLGVWSFDGGITGTSGFHPLYAYALAPLAALGLAERSFLDVASLLSTLICVGLLSAVACGLWRARRFEWLLAVAMVAGSSMIGLVTTFVMEWPLAVLFTALFWTELARASGRLAAMRGRGTLWAALAVLSRSDLVVAIGVVTFIELATAARERRLQWRVALPGGAALAAWGAVALQSHAITGQWLQDSAITKLAWAKLAGPSPGPILTLLVQTFSPVELRFGLGLNGAARAAILLALLAGFWFAARRIRKRPRVAEFTPPRARLVWMALATIAAYVALYTFNSALDLWYAAPFVVPLVVVVSWTIAIANRMVSPQVLMAAVGVYVAAHALALQLRPDLRAAQRPLLALAREVGELAVSGQVGSFNAGLLGYYEGGHVINVDGLMNSEIASFRERGDLACYFVERQIRYLHELDLTALDANAWATYGDPDQLLRRFVTEVSAQGGPAPMRAVAYRVDLEGLAATARCRAQPSTQARVLR